MIKKYFTGCMALIFISGVCKAQVNSARLSLASVLQNNMVVQQNKPFTVWGKAEPGKTVYVTTDWNQSAKTISHKDSTWKLQVSVPAAKPGDFSTHTLTVSDGNQKIILDNILIGEVWLCSGQSNMDMSMQPVPPWHKGVNDHDKEIAAANYPSIRLYKVTKETSTTVRDTLNGSWKECAPSSVADFSGVAYYFGKKLYEELNIPIGLVQSAYGSAACQAFIKREVLASDSVLKTKYLDPYDANTNDKIPVLRPMLIYNAMIHPLTNLSIKGFLWYQGESNAGEIQLYPRLNEAMIKSWRDEFGQGDLPFYFVQMTPYSWDRHDPSENKYAKFREAQQKVLELKNTGIACTMDVGEPNNIHPTNKKPVGERLADLALHNDYDRHGFAYNSPVFERMKVKGSVAKIDFKFSKHGERLNTNDGGAPKYFFVAGDDKLFYPANATIKGDKVLVSSPSVKLPVAVRYAFTNYPVTNLQNTAGFPVVPFRTDQWEDGKIMVKNDKN